MYLFHTNTHPLEEVRLSLNESAHLDFIALLEMHHDYLKESIDIILNKKSSDFEKQNHLYRFFRLVEMHGKAEEEVLYTELCKNDLKDARLAGFAAQDEHDVVFQLEAELLELGYIQNWSEQIEAKGKVVTSLVQNHLKEEEYETFPLSQKVFSSEKFETMKLNYITKCTRYLDESQATSMNHPINRMRPTYMGHTTGLWN